MVLLAGIGRHNAKSTTTQDEICELEYRKNFNNKMIEKKHTPGQWVIHRNDPFIISNEENCKTVRYICEMWGMETPEGKANAQLIATAPELLNACIFMLEAIQQGEVHKISETILRNVIDKATNK